MTRFNLATLITLPLAILAVGSSHWVIAGVLMLNLLLLIGLGSAIPQMRFFGPVVCQGKGPRRCVALTFDDGPDERSTPTLLQLLRESGVKAAFFGVGRRVAENPELAAQIVSEGHLLENHSYEHSNLTNFFSVPRLRDDLVLAQESVHKATGIRPRFFRPPIGLSNPRVFRVALELGLTVVGWTAGGLDTRLTSSERIVMRITRKLKPGAIILLHDGNIPAERLVTTVKMLLDRLRTLEYEVVRLDQLMK